MDLIEKLGGYEKARAMRDSNIDSFDGDASGVRIHYMGDCFYQEDLDLSLLKYRREHNIFEVGDKVLRADMEQNAIFTIVEKSILNDKEVIFCSINNVTYCFYSSILRHATDEEITAGHRL